MKDLIHPVGKGGPGESNEGKLRRLEERILALENPSDHIDPTRTNGATTTNPCGCLVPKDNNVSRHRSVLDRNQKQEVSIIIYQCIKCMRVIRVEQEIRQKQQPSIIIPGVN